jgi:N-acylneuraminate cytidylyltransferase
MAIMGLLFGRGGSTSIKNKNITPICGKPFMEWPILAAKESKLIDRFYISTDSEDIAKIATGHGLKRLHRPAELATSKALFEDALVHAYHQAKEDMGEEPEMIVSLFCNVATVLPEYITKCVELLRADPTLDSAATVCKLNMYSPLRAKSIENGIVRPAVPLSLFDNASCDRDSQGDVYYVDASAWALRPRNMDLSYGELPYRWLGRKVAPVYHEFGCDVDTEWQLAATEWWLKKYRL